MSRTSVSIEANNLRAGTYLLNVKDEGIQQVLRMVKQLNFYDIKTNNPEFFQGYFFFVLSKITYLLIIDIQKLATKNQVLYFSY